MAESGEKSGRPDRGRAGGGFRPRAPRILTAAVFCLFFSTGKTAASPLQREVKVHYITDWSIEPSLKYDSLCLLNVLTGDPFYLKIYGETYSRMAPLLNRREREALAGLKRRIKDEGGNVISAFLCPLLSPLEAENPSDLAGALESPEELKAVLLDTPFFNEARWSLFLSVREELGIALRFLERIGFESIWRGTVLPRIQDRIREVGADLPRYNAAAEVEKVLGRELVSRRITVYLLEFNLPHGIKLAGTRFITHRAAFFETVVRNAAHEMLHPPYDLERDEDLRRALDRLRGDAFLEDKIRGHDPSLGYTSFESFVEEDCVQALEQIVNLKLGVALDPRRRWREADGGMHVLAAAIFRLMQNRGFADSGLSFRDFLLDQLRGGELGPGRVRPLYEAFFAERESKSGFISQ